MSMSSPSKETNNSELASVLADFLATVLVDVTPNQSKELSPEPRPTHFVSVAYPRATSTSQPRISTLNQINSGPTPSPLPSSPISSPKSSTSAVSGSARIATLNSLSTSSNPVSSSQPSKKSSGHLLGRPLGTVSDPSVIKFVEKPLARFNLPDGIRHYPKLAPQNLYSSLLNLPFQTINWKGRNLHRLACQIPAADLVRYPILFDTIQRTLNSRPELKDLTFNGVWINHYLDGSNYIAYHQDSYNSYVCTISIGQTRRLLTKDLRTNARATGIDCSDGDVVVFSPTWNQTHQHSVPKTKKSGGRISIVLFCQ